MSKSKFANELYLAFKELDKIQDPAKRMAAAEKLINTAQLPLDTNKLILRRALGKFNASKVMEEQNIKDLDEALVYLYNNFYNDSLGKPNLVLVDPKDPEQAQELFNSLFNDLYTAKIKNTNKEPSERDLAVIYEAAKKQADEFSKNVFGSYNPRTKQTLLNSNYLKTPVDLLATSFHELGGHQSTDAKNLTLGKTLLKNVKNSALTRLKNLQSIPEDIPESLGRTPLITSKERSLLTELATEQSPEIEAFTRVVKPSVGHSAEYPQGFELKKMFDILQRKKPAGLAVPLTIGAGMAAGQDAEAAEFYQPQAKRQFQSLNPFKDLVEGTREAATTVRKPVEAFVKPVSKAIVDKVYANPIKAVDKSYSKESDVALPIVEGLTELATNPLNYASGGLSIADLITDLLKKEED